jgi:hypothetical protein
MAKILIPLQRKCLSNAKSSDETQDPGIPFRYWWKILSVPKNTVNYYKRLRVLCLSCIKGLFLLTIRFNRSFNNSVGSGILEATLLSLLSLQNRDFSHFILVGFGEGE